MTSRILVTFARFCSAICCVVSLELTGHEVHHVMNITDVGHMVDDAEDGDDKMKVAMQKLKEGKKSYKVPEGAIENPNDPFQIANYFTDAFLGRWSQAGL